MFIRRDGSSSTRFLAARVGLFFLGAGVWLGGVVTGDERATGAAIAIVLAAVVLGMLVRDRKQDTTAPEDEEMAEDLDDH